MSRLLSGTLAVATALTILSGSAAFSRDQVIDHRKPKTDTPAPAPGAYVPPPAAAIGTPPDPYGLPGKSGVPWKSTTDHRIIDPVTHKPIVTPPNVIALQLASSRVKSTDQAMTAADAKFRATQGVLTKANNDLAKDPTNALLKRAASNAQGDFTTALGNYSNAQKAHDDAVQAQFKAGQDMPRHTKSALDSNY